MHTHASSMNSCGRKADKALGFKRWQLVSFLISPTPIFRVIYEMGITSILNLTLNKHHNASTNVSLLLLRNLIYISDVKYLCVSVY